MMYSLSITKEPEENHDNKSGQSENRLRLKTNPSKPSLLAMQCAERIDEITEYAISMAATSGFQQI
jgi:hypothetical protein